MNYIIFNADGSVNKQDFDYYIQQGSVGDTFFISKASIVSQAGLTAVAIFTLPNGTTNTVAGVWEVKEIEGQNYVGYTFTLGSAQTLYNGLIPVSIMISSSVLNTTLLTYPVALVINETGVLPSTDTGITIQEINSYLAQLRNYQEKYTLENVRYYQAEPTNAEINKLAENQVVFVNTGINHDIVSIYQKTNNVLQQVFNLDLGNKKIVNLANPTNNGDAMNKQYADSHYASKTNVSVSKTASNNAITIDLRTGTGSLWVETATLTPATSSNAGLMSASDKVAIDTTIPASVSASGHDLSFNTTTYILSLLDANDNVLGSVNLPVGETIISGRYDSTNKTIILTLRSGQEITIPVGDLVSGLAQDNAVVHKAGNETITGTKTFTDNAGFSTKVNENGVEVIDSGSGHTAKYLNYGINYDNNSYSYPDASGKLLTEEKANLQKYAEKDGDYPLLTAGKADVADNLKLETEVNSTTPYKFDMVGNSGSLDVESGNTAHLEKIQGVSVVFNQLFQKADTSQPQTVSGITITDNQDGSYTINGTATDNGSVSLGVPISVINTHKYLLKGAYGGSASTYYLSFLAADYGTGAVGTTSESWSLNVSFVYKSGTTFDNLKIIPQVVDYTLMFGNNSRIPTEFLSGKTEYDIDGSFTRTVSVASIFNRYFPETYYAYNTGTLIHTQLNGELVSVGKNAFDKDHPNDYIKVIPEQVYALLYGLVNEYDNDKNLIRNSAVNVNTWLLSPNTHYVKITWYDASANNYFQLRHTGNYLGYKAYEKETNQLPFIARLSGLWGVSGDEYTQKGVSTSRYYLHTFTGNEGFNSYANERFYTPFFSQQVKIPVGDALPNVLCNAYITTNSSDILTDKTITVSANGNLTFRDTGFSTVADFVEFITGKTIIFELATPTTDTNEQWAEFFYVDDSGTTEFSQTTGNFAPVGQKTYFQANASDMIINTANTLTTKGGLSANNTWTGTNTFTQPLTDGTNSVAVANIATKTELNNLKAYVDGNLYPDVKNWKQVQKLVRDGLAQTYFNVGDCFDENYIISYTQNCSNANLSVDLSASKLFAILGQSYELTTQYIVYNGTNWICSGKIVDNAISITGTPASGNTITYKINSLGTIRYLIMGFDQETPVDNTRTYSMTLAMKYTFGGIAFDAREAFFYNGTNAPLPAGTYYFKMGAQTWFAGDVGKFIKFTLTQPLPVGGQLVWQQNYNATAIGANIKVFATKDTLDANPTETVTMSEGSDGTYLGEIKNGFNTTGTYDIYLNHCQRALMGNNRWKDSAIRQWCNSANDKDHNWKGTNGWDRQPSWFKSKDGFLYQVDSDLLEVIGECVKDTELATCDIVSGGANHETTNDKVWLLDRFEIQSCSQAEAQSHTVYTWWHNLLGDTYGDWRTDTRFIKTNTGGSAQYWWLRSPSTGGGGYARFVCNNGLVDGSNAFAGGQVAVVFAII